MASIHEFNSTYVEESSHSGSEENSSSNTSNEQERAAKENLKNKAAEIDKEFNFLEDQSISPIQKGFYQAEAPLQREHIFNQTQPHSLSKYNQEFEEQKDSLFQQTFPIFEPNLKNDSITKELTENVYIQTSLFLLLIYLIFRKTKLRI
jgi:hypothetical protein